MSYEETILLCDGIFLGILFTLGCQYIAKRKSNGSV